MSNDYGWLLALAARAAHHGQALSSLPRFGRRRRPLPGWLSDVYDRDESMGPCGGPYRGAR